MYFFLFQILYQTWEALQFPVYPTVNIHDQCLSIYSDMILDSLTWIWYSITFIIAYNRFTVNTSFCKLY